MFAEELPLTSRWRSRGSRLALYNRRCPHQAQARLPSILADSSH